MTTSDTRSRADRFLRTLVEKLKAVPFQTIASWPDYPSPPPLDLEVPKDLGKYKFTLMKDTLPSGDIRVAVQMYRARFVGGQMTADGFVVSPNGNVRALSQEDLWAVT
jgi:hypothetical protein